MLSLLPAIAHKVLQMEACVCAGVHGQVRDFVYFPSLSLFARLFPSFLHALGGEGSTFGPKGFALSHWGTLCGSRREGAQC